MLHFSSVVRQLIGSTTLVLFHCSLKMDALDIAMYLTKVHTYTPQCPPPNFEEFLNLEVVTLPPSMAREDMATPSDDSLSEGWFIALVKHSSCGGI